MARKSGRIDPADSKGQKTPLSLPWVPHHVAGMSGDHPGVRNQIPDSPAGATGRSPEPASAGLNPGPEILAQPGGGVGVEEQLPVQRADVITRINAPLLLGIPLPPEAVLTNLPHCLVETNSSYIPEIDHHPFSPPSPLFYK